MTPLRRLFQYEAFWNWWQNTAAKCRSSTVLDEHQRGIPIERSIRCAVGRSPPLRADYERSPEFSTRLLQPAVRRNASAACHGEPNVAVACRADIQSTSRPKRVGIESPVSESNPHSRSRSAVVVQPGFIQPAPPTPTPKPPVSLGAGQIKPNTLCGKTLP